jgi:hypothetical protein
MRFSTPVCPKADSLAVFREGSGPATEFENSVRSEIWNVNRSEQTCDSLFPRLALDRRLIACWHSIFSGSVTKGA